jgi:hypothetical protein
MSITIDATALSYYGFLVYEPSGEVVRQPGNDGGWYRSDRPWQLDLADGDYSLTVVGGQVGTLPFSVAQGRLRLEPSLGYANGDGTSTLTVLGAPVTIDAEALLGGTVVLANTYPDPEAPHGAFPYRGGRYQLLPNSPHQVIYGSGQITDITFEVVRSPKTGSYVVKYAAPWDVGNGGCLYGRGRPLLVFLGYRILIEAVDVDVDAVTLAAVNDGRGGDSVLAATLLPFPAYAFVLRSGRPLDSRATLGLALGGQWSISPELQGMAHLDVSGEVPVLRFTASS